MKNKKILVALLALVLVGLIGTTVAYYTTTATFNNDFTTGTYSTSIVEEFESPNNWTPGTTTTKKVNVKNNGSVEVAVRAKYTESWTASDGTDLSTTRDGESIAQFSINSNWIEATDGYYYYNDTLATGETSSDFISSVTFNPNFTLKDGEDIKCTTTTEEGKTTVECVNLTSGYAGAKYRLNITIETIQADQKWSYTIDPSAKKYTIGDVVTIGSEKFNVISDNGNTVTMLAQYNLGINYQQSTTANDVEFSDSDGWEYTPGPKEIDIQSYAGPVKTYINNYVSYLQSETGDSTLSGTLITLVELEDLECTVSSDYAWGTGGWTCENSSYASWLVNGQNWWTRSSYSDDSSRIWGVDASSGLYDNSFNGDFLSVRPVITVSKASLANS